MKYVLIEDPKEIRRLNDRLATKLRRALPQMETRTIGYPLGNVLSSWAFCGSVAPGSSHEERKERRGN